MYTNFFFLKTILLHAFRRLFLIFFDIFLIFFDIFSGKRDREDLMTTYRMVIQERATLEHAVTKLSEQRNNTMTQINQHQEKERFLRTQLKEATSELNRYRIDLNEKERITSDVMERNEHLNQRLERTRTTEGSIRSQVNQARDMTAAMASESETLRYDNARLLQLADAARTRIEELEHRLRVTIGQLNTCTNQMESLELMLIAERNERGKYSKRTQ